MFHCNERKAIGVECIPVQSLQHAAADPPADAKPVCHVVFRRIQLSSISSNLPQRPPSQGLVNPTAFNTLTLPVYLLYFRKTRRMLPGFRFPRLELTCLLAALPALVHMAARACHPRLMFTRGYAAQSTLILFVYLAAFTVVLWMFTTAHVLHRRATWLLLNAGAAEAALLAREQEKRRGKSLRASSKGGLGT